MRLLLLSLLCILQGTLFSCGIATAEFDDDCNVSTFSNEPLSGRLMCRMVEFHHQDEFRKAQFVGRMALLVMVVNLNDESRPVFANYLAAQGRIEYDMDNGAFGARLIELSNTFPARAETPPSIAYNTILDLVLAMCYADEGRFDDAVALLNALCDSEVVRQHVGNQVFAEILATNAQVRLASGDVTGAFIPLAHAGRLNAQTGANKSFGYWIAVGKLRFAQEQYLDALDATESVLKWCQEEGISTSKRFVAEALLLRARILTKMHRTAEAIVAYSDALSAYQSRLGVDSARIQELKSEMRQLEQ